LGILAVKWESKTYKIFENEIIIEDSC